MPADQSPSHAPTPAAPVAVPPTGSAVLPIRKPMTARQFDSVMVSHRDYQAVAVHAQHFGERAKAADGAYQAILGLVLEAHGVNPQLVDIQVDENTRELVLTPKAQATA